MFVTLYGKGAVTIHGDQEAYYATNGQIKVPIKYAAQVKALGFSETPPPEPEAPAIAAVASLGALSPAVGTSAPPVVLEPVKPVLPTTGLHYKLRDALIGIGVDVEKANTITRVDPKAEEYHEALAAGLSDAEAREMVYGLEA